MTLDMGSSLSNTPTQIPVYGDSYIVHPEVMNQVNKRLSEVAAMQNTAEQTPPTPQSSQLISLGCGNSASAAISKK